MTRAVVALRADAVLQARNGFYAAAAFVALFAMIGLGYLPAPVRALLLPPLVQSNLLIGTFYFVAAAVLLERAEGTLEALVVSPLRDHEYLLSKVATLATLGLAENLIIVTVAHGPGFDALPLCAGIVLAAAVYVLIGFIAVAPYRSINRFLFPSMPWVLLLSLQYLHYARMVPDPWDGLLWVLPLQPSLSLMTAAFRPVPTAELVYGLLAGAAWVAVLLVAAQRAYRNHVVGSGGARA